ncbi:uracil-DNA glycosylase [Bordetella bronchiseptica]|uniref:uracil-DNA glycosylase n=2 Tax=Bordetella bronchiseptica TaxID=518 RepID=UPI000528E5ED|nr:uracil-DNA glycosylase [Bordetella bronchiseptica]AMG89865.1 uracil-DNA glycosylase [Bordetella bronchiseptica]AWP81181.1 uracil-DNA glycosylase [Bordetella bronchiseptica]AZW13861.1 uracil-DNA glycosylase [Bordetella bronchiseptica]QBS70394.1 uracil-DNA glycosylase [Bordetella bronchiseptica]SUV70820.1 bacteriophage-related DNA polymerase [Bordetella bronchiseptica]
MSAPEAAVPAAPRPNPLQRIWLREIGIEKTWLPAPLASAAGAAAPAAPVAEAANAAVATAEAVRPAAATPRADGPAASPARAPRPPVAAPQRAEPAAEADGQAARAAVAARAAGADLGQLQQLVQDCTACGLCQGRRHAVFGMGAQPARWMVVGEAPGEQEDRQGLPFVGRSGKLLDAMLQSVGMSRERDVFIANVIKCRPPGNRNPKPEEIAACSPYLRRQIALLNPERILVLGRFAAQTLLGTEATIGNLRGRVHSLQTDEGRSIPVVVSYHPAYLLRSPAEKARAWQDLLLAARG